MKIGPVFAPIFEHHQKLVFDAERVGLAASRLLFAFGVRKHRRHCFECVPLNTRKPPEYFTFQLFDRIIVASLWRQRIKQSLKEGYARGLHVRCITPEFRTKQRRPFAWRFPRGGRTVTSGRAGARAAAKARPGRDRAA